ncbi:MAG: hypothetical protein A2152_04185 [Candidatus Levybacteria bacterium RBG_16_35_6]|uniref:MazG nucleotide pyrophosphohydrolase n=1 Tax=Candidatus Woesebacteria bacterium RBG_13_36_22 TaxID=1802478 RepID=A0A1F7X1C6_9BACT|nr:MAG: hypothetical protein A2152_04185 [Candidatus Levybacteria bacterium RBG_16_35_6]OGM08519.1 MAG: hypothetical protein A2Z67_02195 [Candidatus Woesebacteria bacterium RBG_13_36_22]
MKSIVICGSKRFKTEARRFGSQLQKLGVVVYMPYFHEGKDEWDKLSQQYKDFIALGLTHDHFYKIKMADVVLLFNKGGYCGVSSTLELGCAVALGKPIYALSDKDDEIVRKTLIREIIKTPKELVKKLK